MFSNIKRRVSVIAALALMAAVAPAISSSSVSAAPNLATAPATAGDGPTYQACPASANIPSAGMTDTTSTDVDCIAYYGISKGVTATTYEPDSSVTRWQMALYLTRMAALAGHTLGSGADQGFTDIGGKSAEIQTAINQLKQLGVTTGKTATTYAPDETVSREQMAMFIERLLGKSQVGPGGSADTATAPTSINGGTLTYNYDDVDGGSVSFEGHNAIVELWNLKVIPDANTVRTFNPSGAMDRGTMATWLTNALKHTNVRPAGMSIQASLTSGFGNTTPTLSISYRTADFAAVSGQVVDIFEWQNAAIPSNNSAFSAATGKCNTTNTNIVSNSLTECKVEVGDPTTNALGNLADITESVANTKTMSYYAWTAAAGTTFVNSSHGSGSDFATIDVSSSTPAPVLLITTNLNSKAQVNNTGNLDDAEIKFGTSVTITAQMSAAKSGLTWAPVAEGGLNRVTFTHTIKNNADAIQSVTTTKAFVDATGKAEYTFTQADPTTTVQAADSMKHSVIVTDTDGDTTVTSSVADNAPGNHVAATGVSVQFQDDAVALLSQTATTNVTNYAGGSALAPVGRTATLSLYDQYGNAHAASAGATVQFHGGALGGDTISGSANGGNALTITGHAIPANGKFEILETGVGAANVATKLIKDCEYQVKTVTDANTIVAKVVAGDAGVGVTTNCAAVDPLAFTDDITGGAGTWIIGTNHPVVGIADRTVGPDGTASVAWNDITGTHGADNIGAHTVALNNSNIKTVYRWAAPSSTVNGGVAAGSSLAFQEVDAGGAAATAEANNDINAKPLIWDAANNTILAQINTYSGGAAQPAIYTQYSYDSNDYFYVAGSTAGGTAVPEAGFELALTTALNAAGGGAGLGYAEGTLYGVVYAPVAGDISAFYLD